MKLLVVVIALGLAACGAAAPQRHDAGGAIDCVKRTDSALLGAASNGIAVAFASPDGVSAIEPVAVAFAPQTAEGVAGMRAARAIGLAMPTWKEDRGDAEIWAYGPYEPPIAKTRHVSARDAKAAAAALEVRVRTSIDACLRQNERRR
jgi:hypothetical protein